MALSQENVLFDPLNRMLDFSGRSSRSQFWPFVAIYVAATALVPLLNSPLPDAGMNSSPEQIDVGAMLRDLMTQQGLIFALFVVPLMSVTTRRLHDAGWSALYAAPLLFLHLGVFLLQSKVLADGVQTGTPVGTPWFGVLGAVTAVYNLVTIGIALLCLLPSDPYSNQYGEPQFG